MYSVFLPHKFSFDEDLVYVFGRDLVKCVVVSSVPKALK